MPKVKQKQFASNAFTVGVVVGGKWGFIAAIWADKADNDGESAGQSEVDRNTGSCLIRFAKTTLDVDGARNLLRAPRRMQIAVSAAYLHRTVKTVKRAH